jgi:hypothetical protein
MRRIDIVSLVCSFGFLATVTTVCYASVQAGDVGRMKFLGLDSSYQCFQFEQGTHPVCHGDCCALVNVGECHYNQASEICECDTTVIATQGPCGDDNMGDLWTTGY